MVMSADEWLKQKGLTPSNTQTNPTNTKVTPADEWLKQKGITKQVETKKPEKKSKIGNAFQWLGTQLAKPQGVALEQIAGVGGAIKNLFSIASPEVTAKEGISKAIESSTTALKQSGEILAGKRKTNVTDVLNRLPAPRDNTDKIVRTILGDLGNIIADPIWALKPIKGAEEIAKVVNLDKPIAEATKIVMNTPAFKAVKGLFSNKTGNKAFDKLVEATRDLRTYREGELLDQAMKLQKEIKNLGGSGIKNIEQIIVEGLENPQTLANVTDKSILNIVNNLKTTYKGFLNEANKLNLGIKEIMDYAPHVITKEALATKLKNIFSGNAKEFSLGQIKTGRKLEGTLSELTEKGIDIFEQSPAVQLAKKGQAYIKAITAKQFADDVAKFAVQDGVEVANPLLSGLKFLPEQAKVIDNFYQGIKPNELKLIVNGFDKVQNLWKGQALIAPSYHIRNIAGNLWNNFLAGVTPEKYAEALGYQIRKLQSPSMKAEIDLMKRNGVMREGWYAKDIEEKIANQVRSSGNVLKGLNPLSQQNYLFRTNKAIGSFIEDNARIAHYLAQRAKGLAPEEAALSVKKYLFDYADLTNFEKNVLKRIIPFYTWSRKNLPIQLEALLKQPAKMNIANEVVSQVESKVDVPDEKFMNEYIKNNVPVRIGKDKDGNTIYFMLGQWLPYAQAVDLLSQPLENIKQMITPLIKAPLEVIFNRSTYFKDTLGDMSKIERYYKEQGEFLGTTMRKKLITVLRNIRLLNEIDRWIDKNDPTATKNSLKAKILNTLFGKTATYDVGKSQYFFNLDTEQRKQDLINAIQQAYKKDDEDKANDLIKELENFLQQR